MDLEAAVLHYIESLKPRYAEINELLHFPEVSADARLFGKLSLEHSKISQLLAKAQLYKNLQLEISDCQNHTANDPELQMLINETVQKNHQKCQQLMDELKLLTQKEKDDSGSAIVELTAEPNSESSELQKFVSSVLFAFAKKAQFDIKTVFEKKGFERLEILGRGVFALLKNETGLHFSEAGSVSVLILPKHEAFDIDLSEKNLRIDLFRSSGAGGQNVNKVESAVRITHIPTKISVCCQDERSQLQNKQRAFEKLKEALTDFQQKTLEKENSKIKKAMAQKSQQKVRFYNFAEGFAIEQSDNSKLQLSSLQNGALLDFLELQKLK